MSSPIHRPALGPTRIGTRPRGRLPPVQSAAARPFVQTAPGTPRGRRRAGCRATRSILVREVGPRVPAPLTRRPG